MKLLIVQLSDIHIKTGREPALARMPLVANAVQNLEPNIDGILVVLTGDLAFSGEQDQFLAVQNGLSALRTELEQALPEAALRFVAVPGNHDCDFSDAQDTREASILNFIETEKPTDDEVTISLASQDAFFDFMAEAEFGAPAERRAWTTEMVVGQERVLVNCVNTAWMSRLHEQPGQMLFPLDVLPDRDESATISITIFHHPYNWMKPDAARSFRKAVEERSDLIFTGHEHDADESARRGNHGEQYQYIEAGAFAPHGEPEASTFNTLIVHTDEQRTRTWRFHWEGNLFQPERTDPPVSEYTGNRLRTGRLFIPNDATTKLWRDPGLVIEHAVHGAVFLDEIYVYPDLRIVDQARYSAKSRPPRIIRGETLAQFICESPLVMISGPERSGKTSLSKKLSRDLLGRGIVPLLINPEQTALRGTSLDERALYRAFEDQFEQPETEKFRQLAKSQRAIIVDDFEFSKKSALKAIIRCLQQFADNVILLMSDFAQSALEILGIPEIGESKFVHLRIQGYGRVRRDELAERWFSLDPALREDAPRLARRLVEIQRTFDTLIGKNYVPPFPSFLLPILQAQDHAQPVDLAASTYGYFYELLIRRSLSRSGTREALDVKLGYLSWIAFELHSTNSRTATDTHMRAFHERYEREFSLTIDFRKIVDDLINCKIIHENDSNYQFKYPYIFFYFVASYLRDRIAVSGPTGDRVRDEVRRLAGKVHEEDAANILLFLVHLSKDPFIIEQLLNEASKSFSDSHPAKLDDERVPFDPGAVKLLYAENPIKASRQAVLEKLDQNEQGDPESRIDSGQIQAFLDRISSAFKQMQLLGQIAKNFPGSVSGEAKEKILGECYGIGERILGFFFKQIKDTNEANMKSMVNHILQEDPSLSLEEVTARARATLNGLLYLGTYGIVRRLAASTGSMMLQRVHETLSERSLLHKLVNIAIKMDQTSLPFPSSEVLALNSQFTEKRLPQTVLGSLVVNHFTLFEEKAQLKQSLCASLGIEYKPNQRANPRIKLLKKA